jgi:hypothetical protein
MPDDAKLADAIAAMCQGDLPSERAEKDEIARLRAALKYIFDLATKRRMVAADSIDGPGTASRPTPYASTPSEAFIYWRGYREGLGGINAAAHDALEHGKDFRKEKGGEDTPNLLDTPMDQNEADAKTIGEYLKALLLKVWQKGEGFNGKRPFGTSGWQFEIYKALIKSGAVNGKLDDENGWVESVDEEQANALVSDAIKGLSI